MSFAQHFCAVQRLVRLVFNRLRPHKVFWTIVETVSVEMRAVHSVVRLRAMKRRANQWGYRNSSFGVAVAELKRDDLIAAPVQLLG